MLNNIQYFQTMCKTKRYLNIKLILLGISCMCISLFGTAQTIESIKNDATLIWGQGVGKNIRKADRYALEDLTSQISTTVESKFRYAVHEEGEDFNETLEGIINTYSSSTLVFANRIVKETDEGVIVLRYLPKKDINKIFEKREKRIKGYVANAISAEKEGRVGDALRYYYWAQVLLSSHPDNQDMYYNYDGTDQLLFSWLPDRIERLFTMLNIKITDIKEIGHNKRIYFDVIFNGQKAYNLDYMYWIGNDWTSLVGALNGKGLIELFGKTESAMDEIRIRIEYEYLNKSRMDPELPDVLEVCDLPSYSGAEKTITINKPLDEEAQENNINKEDNEFTIEQEINSNSLISVKDSISNISEDTASTKVESKALTTEYITSVLKQVFNDIDKKDYKLDTNLFTANGLKIYNKLIKYGNVERLPEAKFKIMRLDQNTLVRSIPLVFNFPNNNRKFIENVSFSFNPEGLINNITFTLNELSLKGILKHEKWPEESKWHIIDFMENYKTAYALERLDYIDKIFADDALIIVGEKLKTAENIENMYSAGLSNEQFKFVKVSKKEYIERLGNVFNNNEFVNIQFEESTVRKRDRDSEVYGIQLAQNYFSANYADVGYLFLMIDLNDTLHPKIYVRSWQPEKNEDGSIIGLGQFFN